MTINTPNLFSDEVPTFSESPFMSVIMTTNKFVQDLVGGTIEAITGWDVAKSAIGRFIKKIDNVLTRGGTLPFQVVDNMIVGNK